MPELTHPDGARPFDRNRLDRQRRRWLRSEGTAPTFLLDAVSDELAERLSLVQRRFDRGLDLAGYEGTLARRLGESGQVGSLLRMERDPQWLAGAPGYRIVGDEEALPIADDSLDLVVSGLALHLTNDTPGTFLQIRRALRPDGLFLAALLGGDSLTELRVAFLAAETELTGGASPRVAPFIELRAAGALLQRSGFALPVIDQERLTVRYDTMLGLVADLRAMGMANVLTARSRRPLTRGVLLRAAEIYAERFSDADGRVRATFDVIYVSGWKPHDSQQKPLAPGSAKTSLASVLKP